MVTKEALNIFANFTKEAERWYKILKKFSAPLGPIKKVSKKKLRFTFNNKTKSIRIKLKYLYGDEAGTELFEKIEKKMATFVEYKRKKLVYRDAHFNPLNRFTQKDIMLITYPDSIQKKGFVPLKALNKFLSKYLKNTINTIHILPFYPSSSDRGFSVTNYKKVNKAFGSWDDIKKLDENFEIMIDGVFNHISSKSMWFKGYLRGNPLYKNHFISYSDKNEISKEDMEKIVRPRTSPLLSEFKTKNGKIFAWTTFSKDQIDLNYKESRVLLRILDVIFRYVKYGADLIRLDAVNYIWKEVGTSCVHLKQTHVFVQLLRDILDIISPSVSIITETNVPHAHNIRYFGNGKNESQIVYNFALPPLVLYTFYKGSAKYILRWANRLESVSKYCSYFNFLASHDGIGLMPVKRLIPKREVRFLVNKAKNNGSLVSYKTLGENKTQPYELNVTWWSALNKDDGEEGNELQINRYIASHAIALSIKGVPGVYIHSLFGTKNDIKAVDKTKEKRDINRKNLLLEQIKKDLSKKTLAKRVFKKLTELIRVRISNSAFHPSAEQKILFGNDAVFSILRTSLDKKEKMLAAINITNEPQIYAVNCNELKLNNKSLYDVIKKKRLLQFKNITVNEFEITLAPYEILWLRSMI